VGNERREVGKDKDGGIEKLAPGGVGFDGSNANGDVEGTEIGLSLLESDEGNDKDKAKDGTHLHGW